MDRTSAYELETRTSSLFGTLRTLCLTGGTKAACGAMLHLAETLYAAPKADDPDGSHAFTVLATRNVSEDFISACAMLDIDIAWLYPERTSLDDGTALGVTAEAVYDAIERTGADALYMTVPDMMGGSADIYDISEACHARNIPLLADNSGGAYLYFLNDGRHPMQLGADMCFDDASHLLPVSDGGAWLHIGLGAADIYAARLAAAQAGLSYSQVQQRLIANARVSAALLSPVEPSDEILSSMDACVARLRGDGDLPRSIASMAERLDKLKAHLRSIGVSVPESDPLRIVIDARSLGETGASLKGLYALATESAQTEMPAVPCVPIAYADNRYVIFFVELGAREQEIAQIFRIASRIMHAKKNGTPITMYLLKGEPEPEKPAGSEDEENLDEFTDISELEAFAAEDKDQGPDEFDLEMADGGGDAGDGGEGADDAGTDGTAGNDGTAGDAGHDPAGADDKNAPGSVVIDDVAAEPVYDAPEMCDPGAYSVKPLEKVTGVRTAALCEHERVAIDDAVGRVCAALVSCHPAWAIAVPGERIDEDTVAIMKSYGLGYAEVCR